MIIQQEEDFLPENWT